MNKAFNCAILTMANIKAPGWQAASIAPETFEEVCQHIETNGFVKVWDGASDKTIFGEPEFNWAFRAWHDVCHWRYGFDFTLEGEIETAKAQCRELIERYGDCQQVRDWCAVIMCEVEGQALYYDKHGAFPVDQVAFTRDYLMHQGVQIAGIS